jgi:DNA-binding LacI/PurR family transcriptional regulator
LNGFDWAAFLDRPVTSVNHPIEEIGRAATRQLQGAPKTALFQRTENEHWIGPFAGVVDARARASL